MTVDLAFVVSLQDNKSKPVSQIGGKAANLFELTRAGFPVPPSICLTTDAFMVALGNQQATFESLLNQPDLTDLAATEKVVSKLQDIIGSLRVPPSILAAIHPFTESVTAFAIRSSATVEDQALASYAGIFSTTLGVHDDTAIEAAIIDCWRSFYTVQALILRAAQPHSGTTSGMAVVIQPMVNALCSGVSYSLDPVAHQSDKMVVNASWGLGSGVVDGTVATDTYWIQRPGFEIERRDIQHKTQQITLSPDHAIYTAPVPDERQRAACLPDTWVKRIAQFSIAIETLFGCPQDIEWVIANDRLWVLQSRPITNLPTTLAKTQKFPHSRKDTQLWSIMDEYGADRGPLLPLEQDALGIVEGMREETCKFLGADRNQSVEFYNGRPYFRPIPVEMTDGDRRIRRQAFRDLTDRLHQQRQTSWDYWGPEIVRTTDRLATFDFSTTDGVAIAAHLEDAIAARRRHYMLHPLCSFQPHPAYFQALEQVIGRPEVEDIAYQLLDIDETPLTRMVDELYALAQATPPAILDLLATPSANTLQLIQNMPEGERFMQQLNVFLAQFGERTGDGWGSETTIATPTLREDPRPIFKLLTAQRDNGTMSPAQARANSKRSRELLLESIVSGCSDPIAIERLRTELAFAKRVNAVLEIHNHYIDQLSTGQLRRAVMAAATMLVDGGTMAQVEDVFYLSFSEILNALRSDQTMSYVDEIAYRRRNHLRWQKLSAPPILGIPDPALPQHTTWIDALTSQEASLDGVLHGLGASPGRKQGRARVMSEGNFDIMPGDIVVARNLGPRWTPYFPLIGAIVLDGGAVGQHAAATAREYGIPAVIGTHVATLRLADGVEILVDGTAGTVTIL